MPLQFAAENCYVPIAMSIYTDDTWRWGRRGTFYWALLIMLMTLPSCKNDDKKQSSSQVEQNDKGSKPPSNKEPVAKSEPAAGLVTEEKTRELVGAWVRAQNAGAFADYEKLYAERMLGIKRVGTRETSFDRKGWLEDRKAMFARPFTVEVNDLKVTLAGTTAVARFQQTWSNPRFRDEGPKQLVIVTEGEEIRVSREEMLASDVGNKKSIDALAPADVAIVRTSGDELRFLLAKKPHLNWISGPPKMSPAGEAIRTIETKLVPEPERGLLGKRFELFDEKGARCEATAEAFELLIDVVPHFGMVNAWEGREGSDTVATKEKRALDLWEMSSENGRFLTLSLKPVSGRAASSGCKKPIWGRVIRDGAKVWTVRGATEPEVQQLGSVALKEADYRASFKGSGESPSAKLVQKVAVFEHPDGRKYAVAHLVAPGERCGQSEMLPYWVILRVVGAGASVVSNGDVGNTEAPLGAVEVAGLTEPAFLSESFIYRQFSGDGLFYRFLEQRPENFDCSC